MRVSLWLCIISFSIFQCANAQSIGNCAPFNGFEDPTAMELLDINGVKSSVLSANGYYWDGSQTTIHEVIPNGNLCGVSKHTLFTGALWLAGVDEGGNLHVAASTYRQSGNDFWPGPIENVSLSTDTEVCQEWDRLFKINKSTIDSFRAGYLLNAAQESAIYSWPGKSNPHVTFPLIHQNLAPFIDINGDQIYNPDDGDYPDIHGDQSIWSVSNDIGYYHSESGGIYFSLEIQSEAFAYNSIPELDTSTFYLHKLINKSNFTYSDFLFGHFVDGDLGEYQDDFVGCDSSRSIGIFYNGDDFDEGTTGYGSNIPMQGIQFISSPDGKYGTENDMYAFVYYHGESTNIGTPTMAAHYSTLLSGIWKDSTSILDPAGMPTRYMYHSDPTDAEGWSECSSGNNPSDRRFIMSSGKYTIEPGENLTWLMATHTTFQATYPCPSFAPMIELAELSINHFDSMLVLSDDDFLASDILNSEIILYPIPAEDIVFLDLKGINYVSDMSFEIYDIQGKLVNQMPLYHNEKTAIDLSMLETGLYVLKVLQDDETLGVLKLNKQ